MDKLGTIIALPRGRGGAEAGRSDDVSHRGRATLLPLLGGLALLLATLFMVGSQTRKTAELEELPVAVRASLYQQTLNELRSVCTQPAAGSDLLHEHCLAQAHFVTAFPECDVGCRLAAGTVLPHAHR